MPHIVIEYGRSLPELPNWQDFFAKAHTALAETGLVVLAEIKSRAVVLDDWRIGDGAAGRGFVHIKLFLLDSRSDEQKQLIFQALRQVAALHFAALLAHPQQEVCLELIDIRAPYYGKLIS